MVRAALLIMILSPAIALGQRVDLPRTLWVSYRIAPVYAEADYLADVIDTLARGDSVLAIQREGSFLRVNWGGSEGWVLEANMDRSRVVPKPEASVVTEKGADSSSATPRAAARESSAAPRADAPQCAATTRSGRQCSRKAAGGSVYCWQHGGKR